MKHSATYIATLIGLILLLIIALPAAENPRAGSNSSPSQSNSMNIWQARRTVVAGLSARAYVVTADPATFRFTPDSFEFDATYRKETQHAKIDLRNLEPVYSRRKGFGWGNVCVLRNKNGRKLAHPLSEKEFWEGDPAAAAESLAASLNRLREFAIDSDSPLRNFPQRAAAWRALATKPPLPEEVRVQRLLAENAVKEKKPAEALSRYETGLELYPTWPQGYFNAALIAAELGYFPEAVEHMQAYLELIPDAPDAQSARDQIAIWQYKAKGTR